MLGRWTFRIATTIMPMLTALEVQMQQHAFDFWALGAAGVGAVIVAILHLGRAASDPPAAAIAGFTAGTKPPTASSVPPTAENQG